MAGQRNDKERHDGPYVVDRRVRTPNHFGMGAVSFSPDGEATALNVRLNDRVFHLPRLDVGPPGDSWDTIFYLNISRDYEPVLFEEAAQWFAKQFIRDTIDIVVTPPSNKSAECLRHAVEIANDRLIQVAIQEERRPKSIHHIQLLGGKYQADLQYAQQDLTDFYFPITTPEGKYIGMSKTDAQYLRERYKEKNDPSTSQTIHLAIADDVYSTGKTLDAIKGLLGKATDGRVSPHIYILARESTEPFERLPADVTAAMYILSVHGGISPRRSVALSG